jgi:hypothetical protein
MAVATTKLPAGGDSHGAHSHGGDHAQCGNCGSTLTGPYCSNCGQHAHESARSIAALFHDAWHIATHVDDRFWQTMYTLLLRPGKLTKEYFAEHRARYLPPVRVYLVLSVLFFAFGSISPNNMNGSLKSLRAAPERLTLPEPTPKLESKPTVTPSPPTRHASNTAAAIEAKTKAPLRADADDDDDSEIFGSDAAGNDAVGKDAVEKSAWSAVFNHLDCKEVHSDIKWLEKPMQKSCSRNVATHGEAVKEAFIHNIPKMMFVFVPMMALAMLLLYWWPRHYYVEHLVFFLHNHAAVFLILLVETFLSWIAALLGWKTFGRWVIGFITLYTIWYVYSAMRAYYGQGRWLTLTKLSVVGLTYLIGFSITLLVTLIVSALIT